MGIKLTEARDSKLIHPHPQTQVKMVVFSGFILEEESTQIGCSFTFDGEASVQVRPVFEKTVAQRTLSLFLFTWGSGVQIGVSYMSHANVVFDLKYCP